MASFLCLAGAGAAYVLLTFWPQLTIHRTDRSGSGGTATMHAAETSTLSLARELKQARMALSTLRAEASERVRLTELTKDAAARARIDVSRLEAELEDRDREMGQLRGNARSLILTIEKLETRLARLDAQSASTRGLLQGYMDQRVAAIAGLLSDVGVDHEAFLTRAMGGEGDGRGGPLELVDESGLDSGQHRGAPQLVADLDRMLAAQRLVTQLPLISPLDYYHVTSTFGRRKDPMTSQRAMHRGLDLGAATGSKVLATAPGTVVRAGRNGAYGKMVEIDHGLGIVTRYGHLAKVSVAVGDDVGFRQPIGVIGSTGRSTGRHLHYEIVIDDQPRDPVSFLDAGRHIFSLFEG